MHNYFHPSSKQLSERLGISYNDVNYKQLISIDIDPAVKVNILHQKLTYDYKIVPLEPGFDKLIINIPQVNQEYEYIFHDSKMISKPAYYSRDWPTYSSKYFVFHCSDSTLLNHYSIAKLDSFVAGMLDVLECGAVERSNLEQQKIHYILCQDYSEITKLTGFSARGLYYLAEDFISSTFNSHYHEVAHLLINYKLKSLDLYTLPFLQEGFAVAYGGRGGKAPGVIMDMGAFLVKSNFADYTMLMSNQEFYKLDATLSYPVSGIYVRFLIEKTGIGAFLKLYKKYSSNNDGISKLVINSTDIPNKSDWKNYTNSFRSRSLIEVSGINKDDYPEQILSGSEFQVLANTDRYLFILKDNIGLKTSETSGNYISKLFSDIFPGKTYKNEKYIITGDESEVSVYNLYTNSLEAKFARGFTITAEPVQSIGGYYIFTVSKKVFNESLNDLRIVTPGN